MLNYQVVRRYIKVFRACLSYESETHASVQRLATNVWGLVSSVVVGTLTISEVKSSTPAPVVGIGLFVTNEKSS